MRNQFFYTVKHMVANTAPTRANDEPIERTVIASFNMDKVIRSLEMEDGTLIIILDDFHTEIRPTIAKNQNGKDIVKEHSVTVQSEITLSKEDKERFLTLTNVEKEWKLESC